MSVAVVVRVALVAGLLVAPPATRRVAQFSTPQDFSIIGDYNITLTVSHADDEYENNDTLSVVLSTVHDLDGEISVGEIAVVCNDVVEVDAIINNLGQTALTTVDIEVLVNGQVVEVITANVEIPFQEQGTIIKLSFKVIT